MIVFEGADAIGKTSVISNLGSYELLDRDKNICRLMDFSIPLDENVNKLNDYIEKSKRSVIFLITNNREELERRINTRTKIDEFDNYAYLYNLLNDHLFMIDCTGLTLTEDSEKVKEKVISICQI